MTYDENEIRKTIEIMNLGLIEVRLIGDNWTASGYFTEADILIENLKRYVNKVNVNFYFVFNDINEACYSRQQKDIFIEKPKVTTGDKDIAGRAWLMIDLDCERPTGVSSTEEELQKSKDKANEVYRYLKNSGFQEPVIALSGSGIHLLYKISLENTIERTVLIKDCLMALDMLFSDKDVKIDTAVFNASRITKLYGTLASKGKNTESRPHRMSRITKAPKEIIVNDVELLIKLAKILPEAPKKTYTTQVEFDIDNWLRKENIRVTKETGNSQGRKLILEECPFDSSHNGKDAAIFVMNNGAIAFKCLHASCSNYAWQDVRKKFEPNAYDKPQIAQPRINSQKPAANIILNEPDFLTPCTIKEDLNNKIIIKTGFAKLDKKIKGLAKGEVCCVSGFTGSGKSSIISQVCLDAIQQKYKVAIFSGEMSAYDVLTLLHLQSAGKQYTKPTKYEDFFYVGDNHKKLINKWLEDNIFIYNNHQGNSADKILEALKKCIAEKKVDLIVLDNLMALNVKNYGTHGDDKYDRQTAFILQLMEFAERNDVHIVFVAHPRKANGFLRMGDISGSANIGNAVNTVLMCHRVDEDFKRLSNQMFGWYPDNDIYKFSNVIEICKTRSGSTKDYFVGTHYEVNSKRFLNEPYESRHYGWESNFEDEIPWNASEAENPFEN